MAIVTSTQRRARAMIILRVEPKLFSALLAGFDTAVCNDDAPIKPQLLSRLRPTQLQRHRAADRSW
jgi:hypothetical protein